MITISYSADDSAVFSCLSMRQACWPLMLAHHRTKPDEGACCSGIRRGVSFASVPIYQNTIPLLKVGTAPCCDCSAGLRQHTPGMLMPKGWWGMLKTASQPLAQLTVSLHAAMLAHPNRACRTCTRPHMKCCISHTTNSAHLLHAQQGQGYTFEEAYGKLLGTTAVCAVLPAFLSFVPYKGECTHPLIVTC